jgi:hypothetical protein
VAEIPHPLGRQTEQASHSHELRHRLSLQLAQLGELAGVDELAQARVDPGADAGKFGRPSRADERRHVRRRRADELGGAAIGAHGVEARARKVE